MHKHLGYILMGMAISQTGFAQAVNNCRAEVLKQFRTVYKVDEKLNEQESFMRSACQASKTKVGLAIEGIPFSADDVRQACEQTNREFFRTHWKNIAWSYLPTEALPVLERICAPEGRKAIDISIREVGGAEAVVNAKFLPVGNVTNARVFAAMYTKEKLECELGALRSAKGNTPLMVGPGGIEFRCKRRASGPLSFTLSTSQGDYTAISNWVPEQPKPKFTLRFVTVDDSASCAINGVNVGGTSRSVDIDITERVVKGDNTVVCTASDAKYGNDGCPCWGAVVQIHRSDSSVLVWQNAPLGTCGCGTPGPYRGTVSGSTTIDTFIWK